MGPAVVGRDAELAVLEATLGDPSADARLLVLEGEPGIGKTTVWHEAAGRAEAQGYRVLSCRAAHAESRLSFAGLGDLLAPLRPDAFAGLPTPQRRGLDVALLRAEAEERAPDPRTIGTALVSLLTELSPEVPVLLAIDDVQWLDRPSARALEFAVRRLEDHPVAVLATLRADEAGREVALLSALSSQRVRRVRLCPLDPFRGPDQPDRGAPRHQAALTARPPGRLLARSQRQPHEIDEPPEGRGDPAAQAEQSRARIEQRQQCRRRATLVVDDRHAHVVVLGGIERDVGLERSADDRLQREAVDLRRCVALVLGVHRDHQPRGQRGHLREVELQHQPGPAPACPEPGGVRRRLALVLSLVL